ncbi:unnamed protein product [Didymodactylos carnosus]|uniref:Uncharacterized protein n=1 Tax=Didymodactylos carnosus TaxID=1234261 RepID=A0A816AF21_9BILA|nr:unnamed protein product [Didymodactylos carnosus]CAF4469401.1 unnamed protein product [Didymodactylos carnosus]
MLNNCIEHKNLIILNLKNSNIYDLKIFNEHISCIKQLILNDQNLITIDEYDLLNSINLEHFEIQNNNALDSVHINIYDRLSIINLNENLYLENVLLKIMTNHNVIHLQRLSISQTNLKYLTIDFNIKQKIKWLNINEINLSHSNLETIEFLKYVTFQKLGPSKKHLNDQIAKNMNIPFYNRMIENMEQNEELISEMMTDKNKLVSFFGRIKILSDSLNQITTEDENEQEELDSISEGLLELSYKYDEAVIRADIVLENLRGSLQRFLQVDLPNTNNIPSGAITADGKSNVRLPKLEIEKFDGEILKWKAFWGVFVSAHKNSTLNVIEKFTYLRSQLNGDAVKLIASYPVAAENYHPVIQVLKEMYDNNVKIADKIISIPYLN